MFRIIDPQLPQGESSEQSEADADPLGVEIWDSTLKSIN